MLLHAPLAGTHRLGAAIVLGVAALVAFAGAAGILWRDAVDEDEEDEEEADEPAEDDDKSGWISLGFLAHSLLSFRARLARLFRGRQRTPMPSRDDIAMPRRRVEPRFDNAAERSTSRTMTTEGDEAEAAPRVRKPRAPKAPRRSERRLRSAAARIAHAAEQESAAPPSAPKPCRKTPPRSKACSAISACAARSSMRGPVRW